MTPPEVPLPTGPRFSALTLLPAAVLGGVVLWQSWQLRRWHAETAQLKQELSAARVEQRAAASRESRNAEALQRVAHLDESLARLQRERARETVSVPPVPPPRSPQVQELERVILFLREEIKAAHETIDRLRQESGVDSAEAP